MPERKTPLAVATLPLGSAPVLAESAELERELDGMLTALLATGADRFDAVLATVATTDSILALLRAVKRHCPDRLALVEACATAALAGKDDPGLAAFLKEEGIHPASLRLMLTDIYRESTFNKVNIDDVVPRLDGSLGIPIRHRFEAKNLFQIHDYPLIQDLPDGLVVQNLRLAGAMLLEALPSNMEVGSDADLHGCANLATLGDSLRVGGKLDLRDCHNLRSLPNGLVVEGDIDLRGSEQWDGQIPEDAVIGGNIWFKAKLAPMSLAAYRNFKALQATPAGHTRDEWNRVMASGAGVRNAVTTLKDREDSVRLATWALELVRDQPWEVMAAIQDLIKGKRNLAPYVAALREAGIHPASLVTTADPDKMYRIEWAIGIRDLFKDADSYHRRIEITAHGKWLQIYEWRPDGTSLDAKDQARPLIVNQNVWAKVLPKHLPPIWTPFSLDVATDDDLDWMAIPAETRCGSISSMVIVDAMTRGDILERSMTLDAFRQWRYTQGWTGAD